jgi:hypothetical protein
MTTILNIFTCTNIKHNDTNKGFSKACTTNFDAPDAHFDNLYLFISDTQAEKWKSEVL